MYKRKTSGWSQHLDFMGMDILCLELAWLGSCMIRSSWKELLKNTTFWVLFVGMAFVDLLIMVLMDAYHSVIRRDSYKEARGVLNQAVYLTVGLVVFVLLQRNDSINIVQVLVPTLPIYILLCFNMRVLWKEHLRKRLHLKNRTGMLVIAKKDRLHDVITALINHKLPLRGRGLAGKRRRHQRGGKGADPHPPWRAGDRRSQRGRQPQHPHPLSHQQLVDEVYLDTPAGQPMPVELINEIMGMGITVHVAMNSMDQLEARHKNVEWVCGQATITTSLGYVTGRDLLLKRIMDVAGGLVGCGLTGLLTLVLAPFIYSASPGPIFFKQMRIGENGRRFWIYKFRSMYMDAEKRKQEVAAADGQQDHLMFKMEHDPRIIGQVQRPDGSWKKGIGGWIRDLSLDEFPQFFNVLKGDMSLVGTRPPTLDEWERYEPYHRGRMSTKPGITGLWQISGRSKIRDFNQVVQLDREYIENWSLLLDCKILLHTVWVVLTRRGAM